MDNPYISRLKVTRPNLSETTISRKAIEKKIDELPQGKLVLVTGPAGYGKTTFISKWLLNRNISNAWLRIDEQDNDPSLFFWGLSESLKKAGIDIPSFNNVIKGGWISSKTTPLINNLVKILEKSETKNVLVLDDYHRINNPEIHRFIEGFIDQIPQNTHLILASRNEPPFALGSLRLNHRILEIGQKDLAFSQSESEEFLEMFDQFDLSYKELQQLHEKTEGWPAGFSLAVYALKKIKNHRGWINSFCGNDDHITKFILDEVFFDQPKEIKDFLLRSSIMDQFSVELCNFALELEESHEYITYLLENNIFIEETIEKDGWFRYHNLFADFLSERRKYLKEDETNRIKVRAADWYLDFGFWKKALDYFFQAGDFSRFLMVIREYIADLFISGWYSPIKKWLDLIPEENFRNELEIQAYLALSNIMLGEREKGKDILSKLETRITQADQQILYMVRCGNIYLAYFDHQIDKMLKLADETAGQYPPGLASWHAGVELILARGETIIGKIPESNARLANIISFSIKESLPLLHLTAAIQLAINYIHQGDLEYAALTCAKYIRSNTWEQFPLTAILYAILGDIFREKNDLEKALSHITTARNKIEKVGGISAVGWIEQAFFRIQLALGEYEKCGQILEDYDLELRKSEAPVWLWDSLIANRMVLLLKQNKLDRLESFCAEKQELFSQQTNFSNFQSHIQYARFLLAIGKNKKDERSILRAKQVIDNLVKLASDSNWKDLLLQCEIVNAIWESTNGNMDEAILALERAVKLGSRGGYVRIFLDDWDAIGGLLSYEKINSMSFRYLEKIFDNVQDTGMSTQRIKPKLLIHESLTRQEMKILANLETVYSIPEIAEQLSLAPSTVRSHVKHIFSKLGVHSRMEAVITARNLNLL